MASTITAVGAKQQEEESSPVICVISGPMFAGKTTALLRMHTQALTTVDMRTNRVLLVKYVRDTRYGDDGTIKTHDHATTMASGVPAIAVKRLAECETIMDSSKRYHIFVDEGQFFDDLVLTTLHWQAAGHVVVVAALDYNYLRQPWPQVNALMTHRPNIVVTTLKSTCARCNVPNSAQYTELIDRAAAPTPAPLPKVAETLSIDSIPQACIRIGGKDIYQPCCASCWPRDSIADNSDVDAASP